MSVCFTDPEHCVEAILAQVGRRVVLGLPVALGKPNTVVNALVQRALREPDIQLHILTGLSFKVPRGRSDLERRFLEPFTRRVFGDYPELEYVRLLASGTLPPNIQVTEFFLEPGAWLHNEAQQQQYLSANYTHVIRDALQRGLNVMAQLVAPPAGDDATAEYVSLSCNPDLLADLLPEIATLRAAGKPFVLLGQVHRALPFMYGDTVLPRTHFDVLLDTPQHDFQLFCPPNMPIHTTEHAIALQVAALIKDGGTLQLGIGELSDAIVYALKLRHEQNTVFQRVLNDLGTAQRQAELIHRAGGLGTFVSGLYACSEMFVDGFLDLYRAGILKRQVYRSARVQRLLDAGLISTTVNAQTLEALYQSGLQEITGADFKELQQLGILHPDVRYQAGALLTPAGVRIATDLTSADNRVHIAAQCLGVRLCPGVISEGGFFFGTQAFYQALKNMSATERRLFTMRGIRFINELYGAEAELKVAQRRYARFVNTTMMVSGLGAAVSDGLADGRVVSGVGGQYNFVAQAHALPEARSILCLRSTRFAQGQLSSNILWSYGHCTIPRHLRDMVVTEYGIADLRAKTDAEVVAAMIEITDARFQAALMQAARAAGKLPHDYRIPDHARLNLPQHVEEKLQPHRQHGLFNELPFGTDFTDEELLLAKALQHLKTHTTGWSQRALTLWRAVRVTRTAMAQVLPYLARMQLDKPKNWQQHLEQRLVAQALRAVQVTAQPPR